MSRTGSQYLQSLRDGRAVYVNGERVKDVVDQPDESVTQDEVLQVAQVRLATALDYLGAR